MDEICVLAFVAAVLFRPQDFGRYSITDSMMTLLASEAWSVVTPDGRPRCCVLMFIAIGDELIVGGMACLRRGGSPI